MKSYLVIRRVHGEWRLPKSVERATIARKDSELQEDPGPRILSQPESPEEVAGQWLIAIAGQDEGKLQKISTSESLENTLKLSREGYKIQSPDQRQQLLESAHELSNIMECRTMEQRALCKPEGKTRWIHLKKVGGSWKVDFRGFVKYDKTYLTEASLSHR
tara:strand:- start:648 stop:1130 length:483 start_codon:yes stop_codon:yes gene_type:complete